MNGEKFGLTDTERRIVRLVSKGMTYEEVAEETGYTYATITTYASRIGSKIPGDQGPQKKMILAGNGLDPSAVEA